jgi:hypothetical protein
MKTILVDAWNTFVTEDGIDLKMQQLLDAYPNPKIILTNANKQECITFGIVNMPYEVFSLSHQPNKTDADYFTKMFKHFGLTSDNVIYFEHNKDAVEAAKSK